MTKYTREQLEGMTTNERLMSVDLMEAFEAAIDRNDLERVREILESVYIDELSIARIVADVDRSR